MFYRTNKLGIAALLIVFLTFPFGIAQAQQAIDYTWRVAGAAGDDAQYWYISTASHNGHVVCDTWSVRGSSDGTAMTPPFIEVTTDASRTPLSDMQIRHLPIDGLPQGRYLLTMRIRCYDQSGRSLPEGAYLYANGVEVSAQDNAMTGVYNSQQFTYKVTAVEFDVATDGHLEFGINLQNTNFDWVAWKDVRLARIGGPLLPGDYYVCHTQTGRYINAGAKWGTQAVLGTHAQAISLQSMGTGAFSINMGYDHYGSPAGLKIVGNAAWVDEEQTPWNVTPTDQSGVFTIFSPGNGTYLGYREGGAILAVDMTDGTAPETQWLFQTKGELIDRLLEATPDAPADATFLISDARYDRNAYSDAWVVESSNFAIGGEDGAGGNGNFCAEAWNTTFNVYQVIGNIPNGRYQLRVQGLYRYNNKQDNVNINALTAHNRGYEKLYAKLYANDVETSLQSIVDERARIAELGIDVSNDSNGGGMPFSMADASHCFSAGLYADNVLEVEVTNHKLTFGIRKTEQDGVDWTIWDNFELAMLQPGDNSDYHYDEYQDTADYSGVTPANPMDMTSRIVNADCESTSGWRGNPKYGGEGSNRNAEKYFTSFDVYQELKNLPNGWYQLSAQGFYRYGDYKEQQDNTYNGWGELHDENVANNVYAMATVPWAVISRRIGQEKLLANLYANEVTAPLPSIFDYAHPEQLHWDDVETEFGWIPNSMSAVSRAFTDGEYPVSLTVYVHDNTLRIGVKKSLGYKNDWAIWDNFNLSYLGNQAPGNPYAEAVTITPAGQVRLDIGEKLQLSATVTPQRDDYTPVCWSSQNSAVVVVDAQGLLRAVAPGHATVEASLYGLERTLGTVDVTVCDPSGSPSDIVINEIQVSNIDMFIDPSHNYGGYVELYNPTDKSIPLDGLWLSIDPANPWQKQLTSDNGYVKAHGYALLWFDHADDCPTQHPDNMDMDGGTVTLTSSNGQCIDTQTYPAAVTRTSYARTTDGGSIWAFTSDPTPGRSNAESREYLPVKNYERLLSPVVSHESQMFSAPFTLQVEIPVGTTLFYTTDGATPVAFKSAVSADGRFDITVTTTLRLLLAAPGKLNSPVKTLSFIRSDLDYTLPVLSIVSDDANFYDDEIGVFVTGVNGKSGSGQSYNCNWNMEWDRPVAFNYFRLDGSERYDQEVALKRFGGWSRAYYPYNFKLNAQKQYEGLNYIAHQFFPKKDHLRHKVLQVRNGGNDLLCRIKDVAMQQMIMTTSFHLDCQDYQPVHTFINGRYIGMLNVREPSNKHFALANYGIDTDEMDALELGGWPNVKAGSDAAFWQWYNLSASASNADTYRQIGDLVDIDEFINYMVAEAYLGGDDWPGNNCKAFKGNDGKFHIVLFDIDQALRYDKNALRHMTDNSVPLVQILLNMLDNDQFRKQFIDTYCLFDGSVMETGRCHEIVDRIAAEMNPAMALEGLSTEPTATYIKEALTDGRREKMVQSLRDWSYTRLSGVASSKVSLQSNIADARLQVNGIDVPTGRFSGTLFAPVVLTASAPEGYAFRGWQDAGGTIVSTAESYDISNLGDFYLTAVYEPLPDDQLLAALAMPVKVNELSAGNTIFVSDQWKRSDWVELFNSTDETLDLNGLWLSDDMNQPLKYQIQQHVMLPPGGHHIVWADGLGSVMGSEQQHASFKLSNADDQMVIVSSSDTFVGNNADYFGRHPLLKAFVDGMTYKQHRGDQSVGRYPDGGSTFYQMGCPTIERTNTLLTTDKRVGEDVSLMGLLPDGFTLELATGWNWISHPLYSPVAITDFPEQTQRIISQTAEAYRDAKMGMVGTLRQMDAGRLYKAKMSEPTLFVSNGSFSPADMPIPLKPGWNWVGYPVNGMQTLQEALANYLPEEGDRIMGQDGFATYDGTQWVGSLTTLQTGKGYMFYTSQAKTLCFRSPQVAVNLSLSRMQLYHNSPVAASPSVSVPSSPSVSVRCGIAAASSLPKYDYPNVMGVIAELLLDAVPVGDERFSLYAYSDTELRGAATWVGSHAFVTLYGNGGEPISYRAVDNIDGMVYAVNETDSFTPSIEGTLTQPRLLTIGEPTGQDATTNLLTSAPVPTGSPVGYYSLSGVLIANRAASLPSGTYIVRYADGSHRKVQIP